MKHVYLLLTTLLSAVFSWAQVTLKADGPGNTYQLIESKGFGIESPDCGHSSFGPHVTEVFDNTLNRNVFIFHSHHLLDDDRCGAQDRTRMEIKGGNGSPAELQHTQGQTAYYRWKFKLDAAFRPSSRFTHIFQIKAIDGDAGAPVMTITPRAGSPEKMQIIHSAGEGSGSLGTVHQVDLAPFKGAWVEVFVKYKSSEGSAGTFEINIKRVSDGATLLSYSRNGIDMWRTGASYNRPKWGVYRGKDDALRDEQVRFADFCVTESSESLCPSDIGGGTNQPPVVSITSPADGASFTPGSNITINATATDADGTVSNVEFFNGATKLGEDDTSPYSFTWNSVPAGSYTLTARATDNGSASTTSGAVNITVASGNQVTLTPTHDAYVRSGASAGTTHGTTDPGSLVVKLAPGTQVDNNRETYLSFSIASITSGIANVTLRVFGTVDGTASNSVPTGVFSVANTGWTESTITWNNKPATSGSALTATSITNGTAKYYTWDVTSYVQAEKALGHTVVSFALKAATAVDPRILLNSKETGSNPPQLVIGTSDNTAPTVSVTSPPGGDTFAEGAAVTFSASAADSDGSIANVEFFVDGSKVGEDNTSAYSISWTATAGAHTLTAKATDNEGASTTSAPVSITVTSTTPVVLAPTHDAYVRDGSNAGITHGTTDPTLLITKLSPTGQLNNARETYLTFNLSAVGSDVSSVILRVYGKVDGTSTPSVPIGVFPVANTSWTESTITWNNKPASGATGLDTTTVTNAPNTYYSWDLTAYVQSELEQGRTTISIALKSLAQHDPRVFLNSKEASANPPQLVVTSVDALNAAPLTAFTTGKATNQTHGSLMIYPNPLRGKNTGTIAFHLDQPGKTSLVLYDMQGQPVAVLVNGNLNAGDHRIPYAPGNVPAGTYLLKLVHNGEIQTQKWMKQ